MHKIKSSKALFILAALVIGISCYGVIDAQAKTSKPFKAHDLTGEETSPFEINTTIMEILPGVPSKIVAGEIYIVITRHEKDGKIITPQLTDDDGEPIEFDDLRVGQRVVVHGLQLTGGTVFAKTLQIEREKD